MKQELYYLGPAGTFAHAAALQVSSPAEGERDLVAASSILSVFEEVAARKGCLGVVPIENSAEGSVSFTLDALIEHEDVRIVGEVVLEVEQCLLGSGGISDVERVLSHPHGLAQCKRWLHEHLPNVRLIPTSSTAAAAREVQGRPDSAAIASELAGKLSELELLVRGVNDRQQNATRFVTLGHESVAATGHDKTSIVFRTPHQRGALSAVLHIIDQAGINLSRIQSRPMPGRLWQYVFFADLEGHQSDANVREAFDAIRKSGHDLRVFGSYPFA